MASSRSKTPSVEDLGPRFAAFAKRLERPVIFFDTETTGTEPTSDRIVEISLVRVMPDPGGVEAPRTWRIDPRVRIPIEATEIHGITNQDVEGLPTFADIADELLSLLNGADFAGFNLGRFDIRVLQAELVRIGKSLDLSPTRVIDAQVIFHQKEPRNLGAALRFYCDRELHGAHGAEADTIATLEVFAGQLERYPDLDLDVGALHATSNAVGHGYVDITRRFAWRDNEPVFNFGKHKGKSLRWAASEPGERGYLRSILGSNIDESAKLIIREAMEGRIRSRKPSEA